MVVQVLNSGSISGPETLVLPSLPLFSEAQTVVFLVEKRLGEKGKTPVNYARQLGLKVEVVEVQSRLDFSAIRELKNLLRKIAPTIVHAHDVKATTYALLASMGASWKLVSTHHGVLGRPDWKTKAYELLYSLLVLPRMKAVIAVSEPDSYLLETRGLKRVKFVANGISRDRLSADERMRRRNQFRKMWRDEIGGISDGSLLIGMAARLSLEKRHEYFLAVLSSLQELKPDLDWHFLAFGAGDQEQILKAQAEKLGISNRCHWLGFREDAAKYFSALDLLALSSSAEGLPIVALEAGWAGVPLFTSDVGMLPEIIEMKEGAGGVCFPRNQDPNKTAEQLLELLRNECDRTSMGLNLQNRVARDFSAESYVKRLEAVYRSI